MKKKLLEEIKLMKKLQVELDKINDSGVTKENFKLCYNTVQQAAKCMESVKKYLDGK